MSNYSVGNLELSIQALDTSATSLDNVNRKLITMMNLVGHAHANVKLLNTQLASISRLQFNSIDKFSKSINSLSALDTGALEGKVAKIAGIFEPMKNLGKELSSLSSINSFANGIQKIVKLDVSGFDKNIKLLTESLRPFLAEIKTAVPALTAFSTAMASVKGKRTIGFKSITGGGGGSGKKGGSFFDFAGTLSKIYFITHYTRRLGQFMSQLVQSGIDYTETLNLWQVAMRGNIDTAEEFISKMNKAYGIAEETLMRYQATFRNMLITLGGVSTDVSYGLSEYLTQMALDYASLYNTSIEKAMQTFQSVLSGQVRPIRSISGYDITETTIFELYQKLGGTKTMRQLSQTEKRLLRIYAVFQQMDRSGAIGDLNKTLNNTSNQMRIMSESAKELGVWIGKMIELYIAPMLPYINAFLITSKNVVQALVKSLPQYEDFDGTIKGYEETNEAIDEVQGKLLGFDKFRSLSGGENSLGLGIDEILVEGLSQYQSILENVTNKATELATAWTSWWIDDKTGELTTNAKNLLSVLDALGIVIGILVGYKLITKIGSLIGAITGLTSSTKLLNSVLAVGIIASFIRAVELFKDGEIAGGLLATMIGVTLVGAFVLLNTKVKASELIIFKFDEIMATTGKTITLVAMGIASLVGGIIAISTADMGWGQKLITIFVALAGAITATAIALHAFKGDWVKSLSIAGIVAGGILTVGSALGDISVNKFANGGMPEKGTMFVAGEAGAEMVYNNPSGQSGVANIQQIQQAMYGALVAYGNTQGNTTDDRPIDIYIDGEKVFQATKKNAKRHGLAFAKV